MVNGKFLGARVIGWLQILLNGFAALTTILALAGIASPVVIVDKDGRTIKGIVTAVLVIGLIMYFLSMAFGIILIIGVNKRRTSYLKAWIIFTVILLGWALTGAVVGKEPAAMRLGQCLFSVIFYVCGLWVVCFVRGEMQRATAGGQIY